MVVGALTMGYATVSAQTGQPIVGKTFVSQVCGGPDSVRSFQLLQGTGGAVGGAGAYPAGQRAAAAHARVQQFA